MRDGLRSRSKELTLYLTAGFGNVGPLLGKLGGHSTGRGCLRIRRLADVDAATLEAIVRQGMKDVRAIFASKD